MKNLLNILTVVGFVMLLGGCDESEWPESSVKLVPVYSATDIDGEGAPFALEIYQEKPLLIEYVNANILNSFSYYDFVDKSSSTRFDLSYAIQRPAITDAGKDTLITNVYRLFGLKNDLKPDTLWYGVAISVDTTYSEFYTTIEEKQVYN
ncbi:hypothetical protein [Saccharicrinis fermentans]|uniref:Uncharacterized protein n=1 Tax=Saccharicrinis fermentans DSM 9555 = JCM 21142 TaxID=869213 RepID=W7Y3L3_9BACT|nr:hypothetical protein [Saccharicrinis fermentans]GAF02163.1 hypothetical protein JCM21142_3790 [Saccharicrinis fermentans DSM 9555 = JCM 21142]